ncbi:hypothetical protein YC2023_000592 [Brassica napus]
MTSSKLNDPTVKNNIWKEKTRLILKKLKLDLAQPLVRCRSLVTAAEHHLVFGTEFSHVLDAAISMRFEMHSVKLPLLWIQYAKLPDVPTFTIKKTIHGCHTLVSCTLVTIKLQWNRLLRL